MLVATLFHQGRTDMKLLKLNTSRLAVTGVLLAALAACGGNDSPTASTPTVLPATAVQTARDYLASFDRSLATALPATGAINAATYDACFLSGGRTKENAISSYDANFILDPARDAFRIGSTRVNPVVTAERNTINTDGSARREIDVKYAVNYTDGSVDPDASLTLITGSSFGSCATAQNSTDVRQFGNRKLVNIDLRAETTRSDQFELRATTRPVPLGATSPYPTTIVTSAAGVTSTVALVPAGEPKIVPTFYERRANFRIQDPMGNATYVVVTGPGFRTVSNVLTPWSVKMLSPRLLKSDPLLAGKTGNFINYSDDSTFSFCRVANGDLPGSAALADCAVGGARSSRYGVGMNLPIGATNGATTQAEASDLQMAATGLAAGTYTFKIYNDDGWKTINGQADKTPIATYTAQLETLPISFVDMNVTNNAANDKFPKIASQITPGVFAALEIGGLPYQASLAWTAPLFVAANPFKLSFVEAYTDGTVAPTGVGFPRVFKFTDIYPGSNSTSGTINVAANPANLAFKTYSEVQVTYTDRNQMRIRSIVNAF